MEKDDGFSDGFLTVLKIPQDIFREIFLEFQQLTGRLHGTGIPGAHLLRVDAVGGENGVEGGKTPLEIPVFAGGASAPAQLCAGDKPGPCQTLQFIPVADVLGPQETLRPENPAFLLRGQGLHSVGDQRQTVGLLQGDEGVGVIAVGVHSWWT